MGWFAYAPLTAQTFSPGPQHRLLDAVAARLRRGEHRTAINIIATILCLRCPGMTLGKMPLFVWLDLVMAVLVILAVSPLTAAQAC